MLSELAMSAASRDVSSSAGDVIKNLVAQGTLDWARSRAAAAYFRRGQGQKRSELIDQLVCGSGACTTNSGDNCAT